MASTRWDALDAEIRADIRSRGLRATGTRTAVLRMLAIEAKPMSHAELSAKLPEDFDRTTIFRALVTLAEAHLILRIEVGDRVWRYTRALREPIDGSLPATFVCTECGEVEQLSRLSIVSATGPQSLRHGAVRVFLHGRCDACR